MNNFSLHNNLEQEFIYNTQFKPLKQTTQTDKPKDRCIHKWRNSIEAVLNKRNKLLGYVSKSIFPNNFNTLFIRFLTKTITNEELTQLYSIIKEYNTNYLLFKL